MLAVTVEKHHRTSIVMANFLVEGPSAYNALFRIPIFKDLKSITSIYHLGVTFPTAKGTRYV